MVKNIEKEIKEFLKANPNCSKKNAHLDYKIVNYEWDIDQNIHELTIFPSYKLVKIGCLHPELKKCLKERKNIVYFWTIEELNQSDSFVFEGEDDYYWTIFPEEEILEHLASYNYKSDSSFADYLEKKGYNNEDLQKEYKN